MNGTKFTTTAASMVLAYAALAGQAAIALDIDPDGSTNPDTTANAGSLSWGVGNTIATPVSGSASVTDLTPANEDNTIFQIYGQGRLASFNDDAGNPLPGQNLNGDYEWTYVFGYQELVVGVNGTAPLGSINLLNVAGGDNFFRIYFDPLATGGAANSLLGTGFADDDPGSDAILVLEGTVLPFDGAVGTSTFANFSVAPADLDQFGANNYDGGGTSDDINSVTGNGSAHLLVAINDATVNLDFFPNGIPPDLVIDNNYFLNVAFAQTNPSGCFWDGTGYISGAGPNNTGSQCPLGGLANTVGSINGQTTAGGGGPNEIFMTALTSSFTSISQIPEIDAVAGTGAMTLLAGTLALFSERRRRPL